MIFAQAIAAVPPTCLPFDVIVDVGSLVQWCEEKGADITVTLPILLEAAERAPARRFFWLLALPGVFHGSALPMKQPIQLGLQKALQILQANPPKGEVLESSEPIVPLLFALLEQRPGQLSSNSAVLGVVVAGISEHALGSLLELPRIQSLLDVTSGKVWSDEDYRRNGDDPHSDSRIQAIIGGIDGKHPLVKDITSSPEYLGVTKQAYSWSEESGGKQAEFDHFIHMKKCKEYRKHGNCGTCAKYDKINKCATCNYSLAFTTRLAARTLQIEATASLLLGEQAPPDGLARASLTTWLGSIPSAGYAVGLVGGLGLVPDVRIGSAQIASTGSAARLPQLVASTGNAPWCIPRALDVLDWMIDANIALPERVFDPGLAVFMLNPDAPPDIRKLCPATANLEEQTRAWIVDVKRRAAVPSTTEMNKVSALLPALYKALSGEIARRGMSPLMDNDISLTLPVLAKIERQGAWVGTPDGFPTWGDFRKHVEDEMSKLEPSLVASFGDLDPYREDLAPLVDRLLRTCPLHANRRQTQIDASEKLAVLVAMKNGPAENLVEARRLSKVLLWCDYAMLAGSQMRGIMTPQTTGRWGYSRYPLLGMPKRGKWGKLIRSGFKGPNGFVLVSADYNALEARLLAGLSGDPALLTAAQAADFHTSLANSLTPRRGRNKVKIAVYAIGYGQQRDSFWKGQADLLPEEAEQLFDSVAGFLAGVKSYKKSLFQNYSQSGVLQTPGGWTRSPRRRTQVLNTVVQGLGADILRKVLRQLDRDLKPFDAFLVHQAHDQVIAAVPPGNAKAVETIIRNVMEAVGTSPLFPHPIPLPVDVKTGPTWGDLI